MNFSVYKSRENILKEKGQKNGGVREEDDKDEYKETSDFDTEKMDGSNRHGPLPRAMIGLLLLDI